MTEGRKPIKTIIIIFPTSYTMYLWKEDEPEADRWKWPRLCVHFSPSSRLVFESLTARAASDLESLSGVLITASRHDAFDADRILLLLPAEVRAVRSTWEQESVAQQCQNWGKKLQGSQKFSTQAFAWMSHPAWRYLRVHTHTIKEQWWSSFRKHYTTHLWEVAEMEANCARWTCPGSLACWLRQTHSPSSVYLRFVLSSSTAWPCRCREADADNVSPHMVSPASNTASTRGTLDADSDLKCMPLLQSGVLIFVVFTSWPSAHKMQQQNLLRLGAGMGLDSCNAVTLEVCRSDCRKNKTHWVHQQASLWSERFL